MLSFVSSQQVKIKFFDFGTSHLCLIKVRLCLVSVGGFDKKSFLIYFLRFKNNHKP